MDYAELQHQRDFGCIPNSKTPEALAEITIRETAWDATDKPPISSWASFEKFLIDQPDQRINWFKAVDPYEYFTPSQSYRPNCAGFAMANAATCALISQVQNRFSEQIQVKFNPFVTWLKSKGGSVSGGQSIAAIALAGNEYGNYLAEDVGDYSAERIIRTTQPEEDAHAMEYQIGYALYDGRKPWEAILLACRKGYSCFVGNSRAVGGSSRDPYGVPVANLSGTWSHATAFAGYQEVEGIQYVYWINSHGDIYESDGFTPRFGCWMSESILQTFMSSSFNDLAVLTHTEGRYNPAVKPTLNPVKEMAC